MNITEKLKLYDDVKAYHKALDAVLALWVREHGSDYNCVADGVAALQRHPELDIGVSLAMLVPELQDDLVTSIINAVEETGLIKDRDRAEQRVRTAIEERNAKKDSNYCT